MRKNIVKFIYALALLFVAGLPAETSAQFNNMGFESGNLTGWSVDGNASAVTGFNQQNWLVSPANGYMARIEPGGTTRSGMESFLGLNSGAFTSFNSGVFNGSTNFGAIKQSVFVGAGQTVTVYWNYVSQDYSPFNDGVFATLVGPGSYQQMQLMAVTDNGYGSGAIVTGSFGSTGWHAVSFVVGAAGTYTLGLGCFNTLDQVVHPLLFVDNAAGGTSAPGQPVVSTDAATNVTTTSAVTGGNVTSDGGAFVTARGVVYGTSPVPTLANNVTTNGTGTGTFTSNLSGLSMGTTYYVRSYATNSSGTSYGNEVSFTTPSLPPAGALDFDGVDDYVRIANPYNSFNKELTVEWTAIIDPSSGMGSGISQSAENVNSSMQWLMHYVPGYHVVQFYINDNGVSRDIEVPVTPGWHRYTGVASPTGMKFYKDGVLVSSSSVGITSNLVNEPNSVIALGKDSRFATQRFMKGQIDEVRIWNRALCQGEIQNNLTCELSLPQNGLVEYYRFNQGFDGGNNAGVTTLTDLSGNNRHGSLQNLALNGSTSNWVAGSASGSCATFVVPVATITPVGPTTVCGGPVVLNASTGAGYSYQWKLNGNNIANANSATYAATASGSYTVEVSTSNCPVVSAPVAVTVNPNPNATTLSGGGSYCAGAAGASLFINNSQANIRYDVFRNGNLQTSGFGSNGVLFFGSNFQAGTYTAVALNQNTGCNVPVGGTVTITENPLPVASTTLTQPTCYNSADGSIAVNATVGTAPFEYSKNGGANYVPGSNPFTFSNLGTGLNGIRVRDANGCQSAVTNVNVGLNLVVNGDFEAGNTGFTTAYNQNSSGIIDEAEFEVAIAPNHPCFSGPDHTPTGAGRAFYGNGSGTPNTTVWQQTITVQPNTTYYFSAWVNMQCGGAASALQFAINGSQIGNVFSPAAPLYNWQQFFTSWNSGSNTTATIRVVNQSTVLSGNDFGLDDIFFTTVAPITISTAKVNASCANAADGTITVTAQGGTPPYQFSKNNGAGYSAGTSPFVFTGVAPGNYSVKVKDNCGIESNVQVVSVGFTDVTPPAVVTKNITIALNAAGQATVTAAQVNNGSSDACGIASMSVSPSTFTCSNQGDNTVTLTVTDVNGNSSTGTATVTVEDNTNPTVAAKNINAYLDASGNVTVSVAQVNNGSSDNCGLTGLYFVKNAIATGTICGTANEGGIVTLNAVPGSLISSINFASYGLPNGSCGNFTIGGCHAPNSAAVVANLAIGQSSISIPANNGTFGDPCFGIGKRLYIQATWQATTTALVQSLSFNCSNLGSNTVKLEGKDAANNTANTTATVTVLDTIKPVLTIPSNITVNCNGSSAPAATGNASATDNCGATVTFADASTQSANVNSSAHYNYTITRTWTAKDASNNSVSADQVITVQDVTKPEISVPANATVNCQDDNTPAANGTATGTDNCSPVTITYSDASTQNASNTNAAHYNYTITRTWTATDVTGNSTSADQVITVQDVTNPGITVPANATVNCQDDNTPAATGAATGTDNCSPVTITFSDASTQNASNTNAAHYNYTITRTWTATDVTGNSTSADQVITVQDVTNPGITVPANATVNCQDDNTPAANGTATGTDNCSPVTITYSDASTQNPSNTNAAHYNYVITRTWTATDVTGNSTSADQTITVQDVTKPGITIPLNITVNCQDDKTPSANGTATGTDNCSPVTITFSDASTQNASNTNAAHYNYTITRTWTATDVTGNATSQDQVITVQDITAPSITCPANATVSCKTSVANNGSATGTDNCSPVTITSTDVSTQNSNPANSGHYNYTITRTWKATDVSGNFTTCDQVITVHALNNPSIAVTPVNTINSNHQNHTIYLGYGPQSVTLASTVQDGVGNRTYSWSPVTGVANPSSATTSVSPLATTTYTVTITDATGCSITKSMTIQVIDVRCGNKIKICHYPPGNTGNPQQLCLPSSAIAAHLAHGCVLGDCPQNKNGEYNNGDEDNHGVDAMVVTEVRVYPNPNTGAFTVELPAGMEQSEVVIMDMAGKVIQKKTAVEGNKLQFDLGPVARGMYMLHLTNGSQNFRTRISVQ